LESFIPGRQNSYCAKPGGGCNAGPPRGRHASVVAS
jgi:hypothetical protein